MTPSESDIIHAIEAFVYKQMPELKGQVQLQIETQSDQIKRFFYNVVADQPIEVVEKAENLIVQKAQEFGMFGCVNERLRNRYTT